MSSDSERLTQAQRDWGPEVHPDHYPYDGCCDVPPREHPLTPAEADERRKWLETEPGIRQQLAYREEAYRRMEELKAPAIILDNQRRLVNDLRRKLGEPVMEGDERG